MQLNTLTGERLSFFEENDKKNFLKNTRFIIWGITDTGLFLYRRLYDLGNRSIAIWDKTVEGTVGIFNVSHPNPESFSDNDKRDIFIVFAFTSQKNIDECKALLEKNGFKNMVTAHDVLLSIKSKDAKTIKFAFVDHDESLNRNIDYFVETIYISSLLKYSENFNIVISDDPEYILCNITSTFDRFKHDCIRIKRYMELHGVNFDTHDYCVGFQELEYGDRYFQFLFCQFIEERPLPALIKLALMKKSLYKKDREFCGFLQSNSHVMSRNAAFVKLSKYKKINSAGKSMRTIDTEYPYHSYKDFLSLHKFTLSFENSSHKDYVTEKIIRAFASETLPIYYGAPNISKYFNPKAFINCHDYNSFDEAMERVIEIDKDDSLYYEMMAQPAMTDEQIKMYLDNMEDYDKFLLNIFSQDYEDAFRRPRSTYKRTEELYIHANQDKFTDYNDLSIFPNKVLEILEEKSILLKIAENSLLKNMDNNFLLNANYKNASIIWAGPISKIIYQYIKQLDNFEFDCFIDLNISTYGPYESIDNEKCLNWNELSNLKKDSVILCPPVYRLFPEYEFKYIKEFINTLTDVPIISALEAFGGE